MWKTGIFIAVHFFDNEPRQAYTCGASGDTIEAGRPSDRRGNVESFRNTAQEMLRDERANAEDECNEN